LKAEQQETEKSENKKMQKKNVSLTKHSICPNIAGLPELVTSLLLYNDLYICKDLPGYSVKQVSQVYKEEQG
jgi:hypothetical protein